MSVAFRLWLAGLLLLTLAALSAGAALGQETETGGGAAVEQSVPEPAIPVAEDAPAAPDPEWSYRFLVPTAMVLGTAAVVGAIVMYFVRVTRNRYRVIK